MLRLFFRTRRGDCQSEVHAGAQHVADRHRKSQGNSHALTQITDSLVRSSVAVVCCSDAGDAQVSACIISLAYVVLSHG